MNRSADSPTAARARHSTRSRCLCGDCCPNGGARAAPARSTRDSRETLGHILIALVISVFSANAQPTNAPDPLITLMQSQPPISTTAPTQVVALFDPPFVRVGEEATYRVTLDALLDSVEWPEKLPSPDGLHLRPSARGQTFRMVGAALRPLSAFNFRARGDQPGTVAVPSFTIQAYGRPVRIPAAQLQLVLTNASGSMASPRLEFHILATNLYVGQSAAVRVVPTGTAPGVVQDLSQVEINGDGIIVDRSLTRQRIETKPVNGTNITTLIYETDIIPITVGELTLAAQGFQSGNSVGGSITTTGSVPIPGEPPSMTLVDSDPVTMRARPLPTQGKLPGFDGAIGNFAIDQPTLATNTIRVGEPVRLTVTIRGQGNLSRLLPPKPPQSSGWQVLAAGSDNALPELIRARGFATFIYTLIPTATEVRGTPPMPFSYFDPERGVYADLTIPSLPVTVKPSQQPSDTQAVAQAESPAAGGAQEPRLSELAMTPGATAATIVPLPLRTWFPFLQIGPVVGFVALWAWDRRRRFLERHPDIIVWRRARREWRRARRELRIAAHRGDDVGVASWGVRAMRVAVAPHFSAEPRALVGADVLSLLSELDRQGQVGATVRQLFEAADAAQFGTKPATASRRLAAPAEIERALDQLEEKL